MNSDWTFCDGTGKQGITRRDLILGGVGGLGVLGWSSSLAQVVIGSKSEAENTLVVVFLRGGADGLNAIVPYRDDAYHRARPTIALKQSEVIDLDGFFGLHPKLGSLRPAYESGSMAVVHAVGSGDQTRSHFEAMATMERGVRTPESSASGGWLARYLQSQPRKVESPLRAVALGSVMPDSLRGGTNAVSIGSLDEFKLNATQDFQENLTAIYSGPDSVAQAGRETLAVLDTLAKLNVQRYVPKNGARYPNSDLGGALKQVALLLSANVGMEVACLDKGGWDTHVVQGGTEGWQASLFEDVANSLAAFAQDVGTGMSKVTVVVMTEFGRRLYENSGYGTDHGRGSFMLALGGGVRGGKVYGMWPGLAEADLEGPGDLKVTTDYRQVLSEVLAKRMDVRVPSKVFPGLDPAPLGVMA